MADEVEKQPPPLNPFLGLGSQSGSPGKTTWPELVGKTSEEAQRKILEVMPAAVIQVVPEDAFVTMDYRTDRVRIFTDSAGNVARAPTIG